MWVALLSSYIVVWLCPKGIDAKILPVSNCILDFAIGIYQVALTKFNFTSEFSPNTMSTIHIVVSQKCYKCISVMFRSSQSFWGNYYWDYWFKSDLFLLFSKWNFFSDSQNETLFSTFFLLFTTFSTDRHIFIYFIQEFILFDS